ncbi:MAG: SDR family oxidoreductase [Oscillospiraceae bacterium]|nr:SDR family oxidoreductase [Oscillospiraceae bacterium]
MDKPVMIITGGSSGLGLGITKAALEKGYFVCNLSRNPEKIEKLEEQFTDSYMGIAGDLTDEEHVKKAISRISEVGRISVLINSAERGCFRNPTEYTSEDIDVSLEGLRSMILCTTYTLKACGEKDLRIINILSSAALKGKPKEALYCSAKWGERGYTEALKAAYSGSSVKVSAVFPSGMNTGFWDSSRDYISENKAATFMDPDEVGEVIVSGLNAGSTLTIGDMIIERN